MTPRTGLGLSLLARISLLLTAFWLAACEPFPVGSPRIDASAPVPVALLVPQTGSGGDQVLASNLENAARLAIADLDGVQIDLRVYDTGGNATQAAAAATRAIDEGAKIILGPVFAEAANAAGHAAAARGVNVLAFSNNPTIAGGNVFVLGNLFDTTAQRLVNYAARKGKRSILVVHGNSGAEMLGRDAIVRAIRNSGATLAGTSSFDLSQQAVVSAVPGIVAKAKSTGADAIFMTSGTDGALPLLAQLLPEQGLSTTATQFMGLQRWDIPASAKALPGLQGGWFALPDPGMTQLFDNRYYAAYGAAPHPISGLAYDGIAAIGALVKQGQSQALTAAALTQSQGFVGVNGIFRLLPNGTNQRGLAVAQIQNSQVVVIDPAPRSFGGAGF
ncbi:penicillin-binding protein activator [Frigidibacter sp. ROC022]|uniref:penicillin-binding protein activator n=1 Tax=Frigidibacter sp. ROC022 TaxID=2971796 RepID=UPI00215A7F16|nr:penicillin-binding protein activator [Frigidibacter sp. ROC022]MCR8724024.1 penicillin-binding protein activator [Frigidibacter sp. ROC022]